MNLTTPRTHDRPGSRAIAMSGVGHIALLVVVWALTAVRPATVEYTPIAITLYSPPPAAAEVEVETPAPQEEELEVETPEPEPDPDDVPLPEPEEEEVAPPPDPVQDTPPEPESVEEESAAAPTEEEPTEETGEDINVRMEGVKRDYPQYYNNIIGQIQRCFREPSGQNRAVVKFTILSDGTATDIEVVESSGSVAMEVRALEAVECAGAGRFGPLPEDIAYDELPILFSFESRGGD